MNGIELKTLRERLGLSDADVAEYIAGVMPRSYRNWESGARKVPNDVVIELQRINVVIETSTLEALDAVIELTAKHGSKPDAIDLVRYRTPDVADKLGQSIEGIKPEISFKIRNTIVRRTCDALERAGYVVDIELIS